VPVPTAPLPGAATDRLVDPSGVQVHDRGAYVAFDTPVCRDSHWGHRLELGVPPWEAGFARCFSWWAGEHGAKGVGRAIVAWESLRPPLAVPDPPPGVEAVALTVRGLRDCIRRDPPLGTLLRPLSGAADWHQLLALEGAVFGMQGSPAASRYLQWTRGDRRARIDAGDGVQLGAFQGARLVGAAAVLHGAGVGRFRSVCVAEGARGQGIGGALVSALARWSRDLGRLRRLVITAEQGGPADRLYAALGFTRVSTSLAWGLPAPFDAPTLARRWAAPEEARRP
jgi:GNAT superfamily N-acetyltransferase